MTTLISANGISSGYGDVQVIRDVSLKVDAGNVVAVLGPNGAGKTTTLLTLAGELPTTQGTVEIDGVVTRAPLHRRSRAGLSYVTEERSIFTKMTVAENLRVASADSEYAYELFPELKPIAGRRVGLLSGGEQQMLALARALGRRPRVLLADELSLGLAPLIVDRLLMAVRRAADDQGVGVLLVEQHINKALAHADYLYVMRRGSVVLEGVADEMRDRMTEVEASYLAGASTTSLD